jgi:hypothetical protein
MLSPTYSAIRKTAFEYHSGLDMMTQRGEVCQGKIKSSIVSLSKLNATKPNAFNTSLSMQSQMK